MVPQQLDAVDQPGLEQSHGAGPRALTRQQGVAREHPWPAARQRRVPSSAPLAGSAQHQHRAGRAPAAISRQALDLAHPRVVVEVARPSTPCATRARPAPRGRPRGQEERAGLARGEHRRRRHRTRRSKPAAPTRQQRAARRRRRRRPAREDERDQQRPQARAEQRRARAARLARAGRRRGRQQRGEGQADSAATGRHPAPSRVHSRSAARPMSERERRQAGQDVAGQLRPASEKNERGSQPARGDEEVRARSRGAEREPGRGRAPTRGGGPPAAPARSRGGPGMAMDGRREALHVVVQQEDVDEGAALRAQASSVPGRGDQRRARHGAGGGHASQAPPVAGHDEVADGHQAGEQQRRAVPWPAWRGRRRRSRDRDREASGDAEQPQAEQADARPSRRRPAACPCGRAAVDEEQQRTCRARSRRAGRRRAP